MASTEDELWNMDPNDFGPPASTVEKEEEESPPPAAGGDLVVDETPESDPKPKDPSQNDEKAMEKSEPELEKTLENDEAMPDVTIEVKDNVTIEVKENVATEVKDKKKGRKRKKKSESEKTDATSAKTKEKGAEKKEKATETKEKRRRVNPEKVEEVSRKIIEQLVASAKIGVAGLSRDALAVAVGYKNPRSDAFQDALKLLKKDGLVDKNSAKTVQFTEKGVQEHVPDVKPAADPEEALALFWDQYRLKLASNPKSAGELVLEAAKAVWGELKDGKGHKPAELVAKTSYTMTRSTGFEQVMKTLKELEFTRKVGGLVQFTDKMFPFGRPG